MAISSSKFSDLFNSRYLKCLKVLELTPYLLDCTEKIRAYCKNRNYILEKDLPQKAQKAQEKW